MAKRTISPIYFNEDVVAEINCQTSNMPIIYLGLPLHFKKAGKEDFQGLTDKISRRFAAWKTCMLTQSGRLILVQSVLSAMAIFHLMSLEPPPWVIKAIDKIQSLSSEGNRDSKWKPLLGQLALGMLSENKRGLGIMDLNVMSTTLRTSCTWNLRAADDKPLITSVSPVEEKIRHIYQCCCEGHCWKREEVFLDR
jgi:hypothetical protein